MVGIDRSLKGAMRQHTNNFNIIEIDDFAARSKRLGPLPGQMYFHVNVKYFLNNKVNFEQVFLVSFSLFFVER